MNKPLNSPGVYFIRVIFWVIEYFKLLAVIKYIPEVKKGDKRIIILDGNPVAAMARIPAKNEIRANLSRGVKAVR